MSAINRVIAGDYENFTIIDNTILSPILATKRQLAEHSVSADKGDIEIPLTPKYIKSYKIVPSKNDESTLVDVFFHDGKRSLLQLDPSAYETFIKKNFNLDSYKEPEKEAIIIGEIAKDKEESSETIREKETEERKEFINIQQGKTVKGARIYDTNQIPIYQRKWFVIALLFLFPPLGLLLFWVSKAFSKSAKVVFTACIAGLIIFAINQEPTPNNIDSNNIAATETPANQSIDTQEEKPEAVDSASKIAKGADSPMTQKGFPKTYKTWGKEYFNRINKMFPQVALKAAESERCDMVTYVGLSENRSIPKKEAVLFAECKNGERFYFSERDLKSDKKARSVQEQTEEINEGLYIDACIDHTKRQLTHPSSFDYSWLNTLVYKAPGGRVVVTMPCEAKNSFNLEIEMEAKCYFDDRGLVDFSLNEKM